MPTGGSKGGRGGPWPPRHVGKRPECTKSRHFQTQNRKHFWGGGNAPPQTPASFLLHKSQRLLTLVLSPRAICIHITASFPTSNGFWRLKRFKQSMEERTMNCKNSARNALKVAIFRLKIKKFYGEGQRTFPRPLPIGEGDTFSPNLTPLGASILAPSALDLGPPVCKSWIRHCLCRGCRAVPLQRRLLLDIVIVNCP